MIKNPATQSMKTYQTPPLTFLALFLLITVLVRSATAAPAVFPFQSHQFQLVCSPTLTGSTPKNFNLALPGTYDATYKRYLALSGYNINLKDIVSYTVVLSTTSSFTSQTIVLISSSPMNIGLLSVELILIATNSWIWAYNSTFSPGIINNYVINGPCCEDLYLPISLTVNNVADFQVFPFITSYNAISKPYTLGPGPPISIQIQAAVLQNSVPPTIKLSLFKEKPGFQKLTEMSYIVIIVNTTQLLIQNYPFRFSSINSSTPFSTTNLGISSTYVSTKFGGLNGNCLIGLQILKVSGAYASKMVRGASFTKNYPLSNVVSGASTAANDKFSALYNTLCFTGSTCPANTFYNPNTFSCVSCPLAYCTTCETYTTCLICNNLYGWSSPSCQLCTAITTSCLTCVNSTYCTSCINNHYVLNQSSCVLCSAFITGCDTCNNDTSCISCLAVGFYTDTISCISCDTPLPFCLNCDNDTVCLQCQVGYYQLINGSCQACNVTQAYCGQCDNSTICLACQINYFLVPNNTCIPCSYFLSNCQVCSDNTTCTKCYNGYYLSVNQCYLCSSAAALTNCLECSSSTVCTNCSVGYYISAGICLPCTNLKNCSMCTDSTTCIQCVPNFLVSGKICVPCLNVLAFCQTCDNSTYCTSCISYSYYLLKDLGFCLPCSASIINCNQCLLIQSNSTNSSSPTNSTSAFSITCLSCASSLVLQPNNTCQECDILIPFCGTCANYTYCLDCMDNTYAYVEANVSCISCSILFRNCSQCTIQICTKCQPSFKLSPDSKQCICLLGDYINGVCSTIIGCTKPFAYSNGDIGCGQCQQPMFFFKPVYDHCQCRHGTLIGHVCSQIANCVAALIDWNGQVYCAFCNITAGFYYKPQNRVNCVCSEHLQSNGTYCLDICGDGYVMNTTKGNCDDNNTVGGDGCSEDCRVQKFYRCQNGTNSTASVCYFIGRKVKVSLSQVYKSENLNQGVFEFKVQPEIQALSKMDFSNYLQITCNSSCSISSASYSDGIIAVKADYYQDLQGLPCNFTLSFDKSIVRSPSIKMTFDAISNNLPLVISNYLSELRTIGLSFKILSYIVLSVFGISIARKLMGAELLICCQIVYLSNCLYQVPSIYLSPIKNFSPVTGGWSYFFKKVYQKAVLPFSRRVEMSVYFLQNTLFVLSAFLAVAAALAIVLLYAKIKQCKQSSNPKPQKKPQNAASLSVESKLFKAVKIIYRNLAFPLLAGFFIIIVVSSFIHNNSLDKQENGEFGSLVNGVSQFFAWSVLALIVSLEMFGSLIKNETWINELVGQSGAKKWYIHMFIFRLIVVAVTIQLGVNYTYDKLLFLLAGVELAYLFITLGIQVYVNALDNAGVVACVVTQCYSIALPLISRYVAISEWTFMIMVFALIGLLFLSIFLTTLRILKALKDTVMQFFKQSENAESSSNLKPIENPSSNIFNQRDILDDRYFKDTLIREAILKKEEQQSLTPKVSRGPCPIIQPKNTIAEDPDLIKAKQKLRKSFHSKFEKKKKTETFE